MCALAFGVLGVVIVNQEALAGSVQLPDQVASLPGDPVPIRVVSDRAPDDPPGRQFHKRTEIRRRNTVSTLEKSLSAIVAIRRPSASAA